MKLTCSEEKHPAILALESLYTSNGYLRLRCEQICPEVKAFSDWQKNYEAMKQAEKVLNEQKLDKNKIYSCK